MKQDVESAIAAIIQELYDTEVNVVLTRPDEQFGDYATNVALQLAKQLGQSPRDIAAMLCDKLAADERISSVEVAGPGFVNLRLADKVLAEAVENRRYRQSLAGQNIVFEYSDPNPFKVLHAGHLYQTMVCDAIANLLETTGATVHRVNFGGDVGLHVGKTMWAIIDTLSNGAMDETAALNGLNSIADKSLDDRSAWLAEQYIKGNNSYESDDTLRQAVVLINKRVYQLHADNDHESPFAQIYWLCRGWSYDYFKAFYAKIGSGFERYYPESETAPLGLATVREHIAPGKYEESAGAIVFRGEPYGLHTRVFINSEGLPTYEAKDVGLTMAKWRDYKFDKTIIVTGNDIIEYMKVVLKSIEQFAPDLVRRTVHMTHGQVKLVGGVKMSSRKGNIVRAQDILDAAREAGAELSENNSDQTVLGAVKYAFCKQSLGPDVIYDPKESISIHGNSGPYLQYAHARACSILAKTDISEAALTDLQADERLLLLKLTEYTEVVDKAVAELTPHPICTYLYELAQKFNAFYEHNRVIDDPRQAVRLQLVMQYAATLKQGLEILGITAPERM